MRLGETRVFELEFMEIFDFYFSLNFCLIAILQHFFFAECFAWHFDIIIVTSLLYEAEKEMK